MALIEVRNLHKSFNGFQVLKGINLSVEKGETTVILGKSGAGKSVLLKSIIGLIKPDAGSIRIDGEEIALLHLKELNEMRKRMGYLFQGAALYDSMSVRENLEFNLRKHARLTDEEINEKVLEHLRLVGLEDAIDKMPAELSGGMKKRIGLARAIITNPEIMLYDEPTAGLDPMTSRDISYLILKLQQQFDMTAIAVTHDMICTSIIADKVALLANGIIKYEGTLSELKQIEDSEIQSFFFEEEISARG